MGGWDGGLVGGQIERIHLPVETLQGTGTAAKLCVLKSLCGQSEVNKDILISDPAEFLSLKFYHCVGQVL